MLSFVCLNTLAMWSCVYLACSWQRMEKSGEHSKAASSFVMLDMADDAAIGAFICPITQDIMQDPVLAADGSWKIEKIGKYFIDIFYYFSGHSYERAAICEWFNLEKVNDSYCSFARKNSKVFKSYFLLFSLQRTSPLTNLPLPNLNLVPNINLRQAIARYMEVRLRMRVFLRGLLLSLIIINHHA